MLLLLRRAKLRLQATGKLADQEANPQHHGKRDEVLCVADGKRKAWRNNEEIKRQIQELLQKEHIRPISSPCESPIVLVQKKDGTW